MQHIPNSFQVPNYAIDVVMAKVSPAAFKCYIAVMRKTTGWQKESDRISLSQLSELIGMSPRQIQRAMKELEDMRLIKREKSPENWTKYSLDAGLYSDADVTTLVTNMSPPSDTDGATPSDTDGALQNPTNTKPTKQSNSRFTPPTYEEVLQYCKERGNSVDASRFVDFYQSKGWKVGKNTMKDWKAAVRTWEKDSNQSAVNYKNPGENNPDYHANNGW